MSTLYWAPVVPIYSGKNHSSEEQGKLEMALRLLHDHKVESMSTHSEDIVGLSLHTTTFHPKFTPFLSGPALIQAVLAPVLGRAHYHYQDRNSPLLNVMTLDEDTYLEITHPVVERTFMFHPVENPSKREIVRETPPLFSQEAYPLSSPKQYYFANTPR